MKFKKLLFVTTSTVVAGSSLIALAAACHDKNQKKLGNGDNEKVKSDSRKIKNTSPESSQKQNINPELNQKQTDKSDSKQEKENKNKQKTEQKLNNQSNKSQTQTPKVTKKEQQTEKLNQNQNKLENKEKKNQKDNKELQNQKSDKNKSEKPIVQEIDKPEDNQSQQNLDPSDSNKDNENQNLNKTPNVQQEEKQTEQKQQENTSNNSTEQNKQDLNTLSNQQKELELKQKDQLSETLENDKIKLNNTEEKSDVYFITDNPVINQEVDYTSYINLKIDNQFLTNTNKIFEATLTSSENNKQIIGRGVYYSDPQYQNNPKNVIPFEFSGIDYNKTYSLKSVTFSDYSSEWKQINSKTVDLKLSKNVESTKIVVKKIKHKIQLNDEEKQKIPVTVTAKITEKNSKYNIELDFNPNDKKDEINQKYATIVITYSGYTGLSTISGFERKDYKIENNKINITIDPELIKNYKEIQLQIQRITDEQNSHINSKTFILNFENSNAEFDRNKNQFFKFKEVDLTKINNN